MSINVYILFGVKIYRNKECQEKRLAFLIPELFGLKNIRNNSDIP